MKLDKIKKIFTLENLFKGIALCLFAVYLLQLGVKYAIDNEHVFKYPALLVFISGLRWATIVTAGISVIVPFFGGKALKPIQAVFGVIVPVLNLIFLEDNKTAWVGRVGTYSAYTPWRFGLFIAEQFIILLIAGYNIFNLIKSGEYKHIPYARIPFVILACFFFFMYQPILNNALGEYGEAAIDFNLIHIIYLSVNVILILGSYIIMRNRTKNEKDVFFAIISLSGVFNFFYFEINSITDIPLHLCNTAIVMLFLAFVFNLKGLFYFTYFVNVIGAAFAMLFPNYSTLDAFDTETLRFWYNHIYAFAIPIIGVAIKVYDRPNLKMMLKAIFWFVVYFLTVIIVNRVFTAMGYSVDYFFLNSHFLFEKLSMENTVLMDGYIWDTVIFGMELRFFPLFYLAVFSTYVGLMFVLWYFYDALFKISDAHKALRLKKKILRKDQLELQEMLKGRKETEPLYEDKTDMLEIKNFTKIYAGSDKPSVDNFSLTVKDGEIYGFLGHNGAGKSTTIKSIVGIQTITSGSISVQGYDVAKQPVEAKLRIGYVSDNHAVYERLTGREYINYIADLYMVSKEDRDERIKKYTKMFCLEDAIDREIKSYSHGMKQKIVVIASLIHDPKVWILDEPLTGLDPTSAFQIKECMKDHAKRGNIVFFSSHVIEVVEKVCTKICIISHGKLMCEYSLKDLAKQHVSLESLYLKYVSSEESKR